MMAGIFETTPRRPLIAHRDRWTGDQRPSLLSDFRDMAPLIYYSLYEWYNPLWLADRKRYAAELRDLLGPAT
jgi:hypothetical protein